MNKEHREDFGPRLSKILDYLNQDIRYGEKLLPRPFMIEITGSPSSGKTTTIKELDKLFRRYGLRVRMPQEGAEVIRHIPRSTPIYNVRTGLYALNMLLDQSFGHNYDVIIFDRCIFDAYCWMMYWQDKGQITPKEREMIQSFFLSRFWADKIDAAFFMVCRSKEAWEREQRIALTEKSGETTNPKTLKVLEGRYRLAYRQLSPSFPKLYLFDTTKMDEQTMVREIARKTLELLELKIKNGQ